MKSVKLTKRLAALASLIKPGASVADIGTDHGLITAHLAQRGDMARIIASDIKPGPLGSARENAQIHGVEGHIEFVLAPGLEGISPHSVDTIVIAGMGGETILNILAGAQWTRKRSVQLLLQPQSKLGVLCSWLQDNGYDTVNIGTVAEKGKRYTILEVFGTED